MTPAAFHDEAQLLRHAEWVRRLARSLVADSHTAEDLAQETMLAAVAKPPGRADNVRGWLATVLHNRLRLDRRASARRARRELAVARSVDAPVEGDVVERSARTQEVVEVVHALEEPFRTTLLLRYFDGLERRVIAERMGVPFDTVRSRIRRGLERVRERLDRRYGGRREEWRAGLAPLVAGPAGMGCESAAGADGGSSLGRVARLEPGRGFATVVMAMQTKSKVMLVAAVICLGALWSVAGGVGGSEEPDVTPATGRVDDVGHRVADRTEVREGGVQAGRVAVEAPVELPEAAGTRTVRGRVVDTRAAPIAGLDLTCSGREAAGLTSGAGGYFEVEVRGEEQIELTSGDPRYATVLAGVVGPNAMGEPIVVVGRSLGLAGQVVDPHGAPIAGVAVRFEVGARVERGLGIPLDASVVPERVQETEADGRFEFAGVPEVRGARLVATKAGYDDATREAWFDDRGVVLVLYETVVDPALLQGVVLDEKGAPLAGVRVGAASALTRTDHRGRFAFDAETTRVAPVVRAVRAGYWPAELAATRGPAGSSWPADVVLRIDRPALEVSGVVVDGQGEPRPGVRVWVDDPTVLGVTEEDGPIVLEGLAHGSREKAEVEADGEVVRDTPNALWSWVRTDAAGRFALGGLLDREYRLRAFDPETLAIVTVGGVRAGRTGVELVVETPGDAGMLRGVVRSVDGGGLAGATVRVSVRPFLLQRPDGGMTAWDWAGPAAVSDAQGRFELRVPRSAARVRATKEGFFPASFAWDGNGAVVPGDCVLELAPRVAGELGHVQVRLADPGRATHCALVGADGARASLLHRRGTGEQRSVRAASIEDGMTSMLAVAAGEYELVLLRDGDEVERSRVVVEVGGVSLVRR